MEKSKVIENLVQNLNTKRSVLEAEVIGRDEEIRKMIYVLSRKEKNNPLLVGYAGVGKTAIIEGFVKRIQQNQVPDYLKNKIVYQLDMMSLMADTKFQGELESRLKSVFSFFSDPKNNAILFIDEVHLIVGAGRTQGALDFSNLIKPALSRGEIQCIGATTWAEYHQYIEKDAALSRRFRAVLVEEPNIPDSINILRGIKNNLEIYYGIKIQDTALVSAVQVSKRYLFDTYLPDKAIDILHETCARIRSEISFKPEIIEKLESELRDLEISKGAWLQEKKDNFGLTAKQIEQLEKEIETKKARLENLRQQSKSETQTIQKLNSLKIDLSQKWKELEICRKEANYNRAGELKYSIIPELEKQIEQLESEASSNKLKKYFLTKEDIAYTVSQVCNLPVNKILAEEQKKLLFLFQYLKQKVKGQDQALESISNAVFRSRAGIQDPLRPLGSFLFLGPTGTGKTRSAVALAEQLFDSEDNLIRLDMSEFSEPYSVSNLIGAPPGYVGFERENRLEIVRKKPYSVVLLDEIEKAHPEVHNLLLQILDNGYLTLTDGRKINFRNTIIILTSNLGSELYFQGYDHKELKEELLLKLKRNFKPEVINRLDEIIVFNALDKDIVKEIVDVELDDFCQRIFKEKNVKLDYDQKLIEKILSDAYSKEYGARPIKHYIEQQLGNLIAIRIIAGFFQPFSNYLITFDENEGAITIRSRPLLRDNNFLT